MTTYIAGIDGGQTSTIAVIGDESGRIIARGHAGAADEVNVGPDSTRLHDALNDALLDAIYHAKLPAETQFAAIVAGVSGYEGKVYGKAPQLPTPRLVLMNDAPVAHAGALGGQPGVVVIAGTGSVVYATDGKRGRALGGWGYAFGDEGSAFWLVREALGMMMRAEDDHTVDLTREMKTTCEFFAKQTLHQVARAFYAGEISRHRLASFAVEAMHFEKFRDVAFKGADRLAVLVRTAIHAGAHPTVACVGGLFKDQRFRERVHAGIRGVVRGVHLTDPINDPDVGALLLAYREAGLGTVVPGGAAR